MDPTAPEPDFRLVPERLVVEAGGHEIVLTTTQFRLLAVLASAPGRVFSRDELLKRVFAAPVTERTVDVHIKELRRKLQPHDWRIQTVRGKGYRFQAGPASRG